MSYNERWGDKTSWWRIGCIAAVVVGLIVMLLAALSLMNLAAA